LAAFIVHSFLTTISAVFLLSALPIKSQAQQLGFYFAGAIHSPAIKFNSDSSRWASNNNGDYAYADARVGSWFSISDRLVVGVEKRITHYLEFTPETAEFYGQLEDNDIPVGRYPLSLDVNSAKSNALFVKYIFVPLEGLQLVLAAYVLKGLDSQQAVISGLGEVTVNPDTEENTYSYRYDLDYLYGYDELFDTESLDAIGYGHSFDLDATYVVNRQLTARLSVKDAFYRLYWSQLNHDNGCVARPDACLFDRTEIAGSTQSLPYAVNTGFSYQINELVADLDLVKAKRYEAIWLGVNAWGAGAYIDALSETFKLSYESDRLTVKWAFDDVNYNRANHWQITLGASWPIL
jgi:hypothetical protein